MTGLNWTKANAFHPQQHNEAFADGSMYVPVPQTLELLHVPRIRTRWMEDH
jgi:hypothetical protein